MLINCLKLSKLAIMSFFFMILVSCDSITSSNQDRLIARAENHYLYLSDLERNLKSFSSVEDSLIKANNYINNWAREKLLFEKSLINLPQGKFLTCQIVEAYKNNLYKCLQRVCSKINYGIV